MFLPVIHLMHGKEDDDRSKKTITGCRKHPDDIKGIVNTVYWKNRKFVTCDLCKLAIKKIENMRGEL